MFNKWSHFNNLKHEKNILEVVHLTLVWTESSISSILFRPVSLSDCYTGVGGEMGEGVRGPWDTTTTMDGLIWLGIGIKFGCNGRNSNLIASSCEYQTRSPRWLVRTGPALHMARQPLLVQGILGVGVRAIVRVVVIVWEGILGKRVS